MLLTSDEVDSTRHSLGDLLFLFPTQLLGQETQRSRVSLGLPPPAPPCFLDAPSQDYPQRG